MHIVANSSNDVDKSCIVVSSSAQDICFQISNYIQHYLFWVPWLVSLDQSDIDL